MKHTNKYYEQLKDIKFILKRFYTCSSPRYIHNISNAMIFENKCRLTVKDRGCGYLKV